MNSGASFGQYFEGNSFIHRLDPRIKLTASIIYIVVIFLAKSLFSFALILAVTLGLMLSTGIPFGRFIRGLRPILFIMAFTAIINIFWYTGDTLLVDFYFIEIYLEGIINAVLIALRIIFLIAGTSVLLTYTTTPLALTDGLESLLSPLKYIKVPVHDFAMMMTIALRFIPTLTEETTKIMNAQKARGADFTSGSFIKRAKSLIPILIPLLVSAFRRAEELADAMECRCYTGGAGRTRMNVLRTKLADYIFLFSIITLGAAVVILNMYVPGIALGI
ncbi:MAG: energy-coupling factor transporter transmembrane protein EcfT [Ruminococcaceae bacterium]|nr:energy-coupling factor transporter transmembrane protein EcfT [Oscillospiraceae bacterium]